MKGIIVAAGYGTRFLPATKTIPKEMFPLIDTPAIDFIIDEFIDSGIRDILIITSRRKKSLEDYLDKEIELENVFIKEHDFIKLDKIKTKNANFYFVRQKEMRGTGDAILLAKSFIGDSPFIVAYPDDIVFSPTPLSKTLIDIYNKTNRSVLALEKIDGDVSRYGVVDYIVENDLIKIKSIIEKPPKGKEPGNIISIGRYLFCEPFFDYLENDFKNHTTGEFYHINAINKLAMDGKVYGTIVNGKRIDVGDKLGYLQGIIEYALKRNDIKEEFIKLLKNYTIQYF